MKNDSNGHNETNEREGALSVFRGRSQETSRVFSRIGAERPQSVSIIGEPGIGKTAFLKHIASEETRSRFPEASERLLIIAQSISKDGNISPERFIDDLTRKTSERTGVHVDDHGYEGFSALMKNPEIAELKLVFCLDDFHHITENPDFPMEFFSFLRSAANNYNIAYITTSPLELQRLCISRVVEESPFFNIFTNIPLRPLKEPEAVQAVEAIFQSTGLSPSSYADRMIPWAGTAPGDLVTACEIFLALPAEADSVTESRWKEFETEYLRRLSPLYDKRWNGLDANQRQTFGKLVAGKKVDRTEKFIAEELERKGYTFGENDHFRPTSEAFSRFIASETGITVKTSGKKRGFFAKLFNRTE